MATLMRLDNESKSDIADILINEAKTENEKGSSVLPSQHSDWSKHEDSQVAFEAPQHITGAVEVQEDLEELLCRQIKEEEVIMTVERRRLKTAFPERAM